MGERRPMPSEAQVDALLESVRPGKTAPLGGGVPAEARAAWIDGAVRRFAQEKMRRRRAVRQWTMAAAAAAVLIAAALWWRGGETAAERAHMVVAPAPAATIPGSRFSLLYGEVGCRGARLELGGAVPVDTWIETGIGRGAFVLPSQVAVGLSQDTSLRVHWNGERGFRIEVADGKALFSVHPSKPRDFVEVATPRGVIHVTGTLFSVVVGDDEETWVHLHKGAVRIDTRDNRSVRVRKGQVAALGDFARVRDAGTEDTRVFSELRQIGCFDAGRVFSELDPRWCRDQEREAAQETTPQREAAPAVRMRAARKAPPAAERELSLATLLSAARIARREGRSADAAALLRRILRAYPDTPDGRTVLVTLGRLELRELNDPAQAARHFSAYVRTGGPLLPEALWGWATALRHLGDTRAEKEVLTQLVTRFPGRDSALAAQRRLAALRRSGNSHEAR